MSYKEPPQSRLKKLWATDPLEQNSKPGTEEPICDFACCYIFYLFIYCSRLKILQIAFGVSFTYWSFTFRLTTPSVSVFVSLCLCVCVCVCPPGAMSSGLRLEDSHFYDFLSPGPSPLSPPGQSMGSVGDGWPPRANSPPTHGNTVTWPPGTPALTKHTFQTFVCLL